MSFEDPESKQVLRLIRYKFTKITCSVRLLLLLLLSQQGLESLFHKVGQELVRADACNARLDNVG